MAKKRRGRGRPSTIDEEKLALLRIAFKSGLPILGACQMAGVTKDAFYRYVEKHPEFRDEIALLRETPYNTALIKVVRASAGGDLKSSKWLLNYRMRKKEMNERLKSQRALRKSVEEQQSVNNIQVVTDAYYERLERELNVKPPEDGEDE